MTKKKPAAKPQANKEKSYLAKRLAEPSSRGGVGAVLAGAAMLLTPGGMANPAAWSLIMGGVSAFVTPEGGGGA